MMKSFMRLMNLFSGSDKKIPIAYVVDSDTVKAEQVNYRVVKLHSEGAAAPDLSARTQVAKIKGTATFDAPTPINLSDIKTELAKIIVDAPSDSKIYGRKNGKWEEVKGGGSSSWGNISGNINDQTDLTEKLATKEATIKGNDDEGFYYSGKKTFKKLPSGNYNVQDHIKSADGSVKITKVGDGDLNLKVESAPAPDESARKGVAKLTNGTEIFDISKCKEKLDKDAKAVDSAKLNGKEASAYEASLGSPAKDSQVKVYAKNGSAKYEDKASGGGGIESITSKDGSLEIDKADPKNPDVKIKADSFKGFGCITVPGGVFVEATKGNDTVEFKTNDPAHLAINGTATPKKTVSFTIKLDDVFSRLNDLEKTVKKFHKKRLFR